jgi:phage tail tape-measure protein
MARWTDEERFAFGVDSTEGMFQALLETEARAGGSQEEVAARLRERIRRWRS